MRIFLSLQGLLTHTGNCWHPYMSVITATERMGYGRYIKISGPAPHNGGGQESDMLCSNLQTDQVLGI